MALQARMGDKTSHGGSIITGAANSIIGGRPAARMGDLHSCPLPGHGVNKIVSGSADILIEGRMVARMGDVCGCGAVIVTASPNTTAGK